MPVQRKYDDETRARAVRLYVEPRKSDPAESQVASRRHVGGLIGVGPEMLRGWVERDERNAGARPGLSDEASAEVRQLRKENAERGVPMRFCVLRARFSQRRRRAADFRDRVLHRRVSRPLRRSARSATCSPSTACRRLRAPTTP